MAGHGRFISPAAVSCTVCVCWGCSPLGCVGQYKCTMLRVTQAQAWTIDSAIAWTISNAIAWTINSAMSSAGRPPVDIWPRVACHRRLCHFKCCNLQLAVTVPVLWHLQPHRQRPLCPSDLRACAVSCQPSLPWCLEGFVHAPCARSKM